MTYLFLSDSAICYFRLSETSVCFSVLQILLFDLEILVTPDEFATFRREEHWAAFLGTMSIFGLVWEVRVVLDDTEPDHTKLSKYSIGTSVDFFFEFRHPVFSGGAAEAHLKAKIWVPPAFWVPQFECPTWHRWGLCFFFQRYWPPKEACAM